MVGLDVFFCGDEEDSADIARETAIRTKARDDFNAHIKGIPVLECDYDENPHVLFLEIEARDWEGVRDLLLPDEYQPDRREEGSGGGWFFSAPTHPKKRQVIPRNRILAMTWVIRRKEDGSVKWRITPLHAAVTFDAPRVVLTQLLEVYPEAAKLRDDLGNLPLHLAYREGLSDEKVHIIEKAYPEGREQRNNKGKIPSESIRMNGTVKRLKEDHDKEISLLNESHKEQISKMKEEIDKLNQEKQAHLQEMEKMKEHVVKIREEHEAEMRMIMKEKEDELEKMRVEVNRIREEVKEEDTEVEMNQESQRPKPTSLRRTDMNQESQRPKPTSLRRMEMNQESQRPKSTSLRKMVSVKSFKQKIGFLGKNKFVKIEEEPMDTDEEISAGSASE